MTSDPVPPPLGLTSHWASVVKRGGRDLQYEAVALVHVTEERSFSAAGLGREPGSSGPKLLPHFISDKGGHSLKNLTNRRFYTSASDFQRS